MLSFISHCYQAVWIDIEMPDHYFKNHEIDFGNCSCFAVSILA